MSYNSAESSNYGGSPFELYLFQTGTESWQLTSGDVAREYLGSVYTPEAITRTETTQNQEAKSGEVTVTIPRSHEVARRFVAYMPTLPMSLVIYRGHDGESEVVSNFTGRVVKAEFEEHCVLSCMPESDLLRRGVPIQRYQKPCNWVLFQPKINGIGCGVEKTEFRISATVDSVNGINIYSSAFATKPNGWCNGGYLEMGDDRRMIVSHVGNRVSLISPMASLSGGDHVYAYAGCNKTRQHCRDKFDNMNDHFGFYKIPKRNLFDGGVV